jgi:hypothetical protein
MGNGQSINDASFFFAVIKGAFPLDEDHPGEVDGVETSYYSWMNKQGEYYIQKDTGPGSEIHHWYYKGEANYEAIWANRANLSFDIPRVIFG